jgi:hypothetical protein
VFLQMRGVVFDRLVLAPGVLLAVIRLHVFGRSKVAVTVEVDCHKRDSRGDRTGLF